VPVLFNKSSFAVLSIVSITSDRYKDTVAQVSRQSLIIDERLLNSFSS
jgi:hypothetical protein